MRLERTGTHFEPGGDSLPLMMARTITTNADVEDKERSLGSVTEIRALTYLKGVDMLWWDNPSSTKGCICGRGMDSPHPKTRTRARLIKYVAAGGLG